MSGLKAPRPLLADDPIEDFECGEIGSEIWLKTRAWRNQCSGATRTFVSLDDGGQIAGYFALAAGSMTQRNVPGRVRRNMPEPIPTVVLARLAVATSWQRQGIGSWLVADAVSRTVVAAEAIGIRAMIVNAANESVTVFYEKLGFARTVTELLTLVATLRDLAATLALPHPR